MSRTHAALTALFISVLASPLAAAGEPSVTAVLFESRHLDQINKGSEVTYKFDRTVSDEKLLGEAFSDEIKLGVAQVNDKREREVILKIFTGAQARDPSSFPDLTINPLLIWYLDRSVSTFSRIAGGSAPYLKGRFRDALGDEAKVEQIKFPYDGKDVDAYRVVVTPFANDSNASKMEGYEGARFTIVVSEQVPGYFLDLVALFESKAAAGPRLEEHISLVGMGEVK